MGQHKKLDFMSNFLENGMDLPKKSVYSVKHNLVSKQIRPRCCPTRAGELVFHDRGEAAFALEKTSRDNFEEGGSLDQKKWRKVISRLCRTIP
jgi:hypothetical protein